MAVYLVATHKQNTQYNIGPWHNTYHVNAGSVGEALDQAEAIASLEEPIMASTITISQVEASLPGVRGGGGKRSVEYIGGRTASGVQIPPWNVCFVSAKSALTSYRIKKWLRIGLGEGDIIGQALEATIINLLGTFIAGIIDGTDVCMPDGTILDSSSAYAGSYIQMRQTDWKRAHKAGYKRGWVPV